MSVSQSVSGTLDRPWVVAPFKTCGHMRSSRRHWRWAQCRPRSAAPTFSRVVLAGASTPAWCPVYDMWRDRNIYVSIIITLCCCKSCVTQSCDLSSKFWTCVFRIQQTERRTIDTVLYEYTVVCRFWVEYMPQLFLGRYSKMYYIMCQLGRVKPYYIYSHTSLTNTMPLSYFRVGFTALQDLYAFNCWLHENFKHRCINFICYRIGNCVFIDR